MCVAWGPAWGVQPSPTVARTSVKAEPNNYTPSTIGKHVATGGVTALFTYTVLGALVMYPVHVTLLALTPTEFTTPTLLALFIQYALHCWP